MILDQEIQEKTKWLRWMVDFCNADLRNIRPREWEDYFFKVFAFTSPYDLENFENTEDEASRYRKFNGRYWLPGEKFNKSRMALKDELNYRFGLNESNIEGIQERFRAILDYWLSKEAQGEDQLSPGISLPFLYQPSFIVYQGKFKIRTGKISLESSSKLEPIIRQHRAAGEFLDKYKRLKKALGLDLFGGKRIAFLKGREKDFYYNALRKVCELLDNIPTGWIRKCKGCGRFFFHATKIEKIYCSSSCAARSIQRAKREELYRDEKKHKAYNERMKKIMRTRRRNQLRAELGPNVKVGRNI